MSDIDFYPDYPEITDEIFNVADSGNYMFVHNSFYNSASKPVEIWTGAGKTGTQVTAIFGNPINNNDLPDGGILPDIAYTTASIANATYHGVDLYVSYYPLGDLWSSFKANAIIPQIPIQITIGPTDDMVIDQKRNYYFTIDTSLGNLTKPVPDGLFVGQRVNILSIGANLTLIDFTGKVAISSVPVSNGRVLTLEWFGSVWIATDSITAVVGDDSEKTEFTPTKETVYIKQTVASSAAIGPILFVGNYEYPFEIAPRVSFSIIQPIYATTNNTQVVNDLTAGRYGVVVQQLVAQSRNYTLLLTATGVY